MKTKNKIPPSQLQQATTIASHIISCFIAMPVKIRNAHEKM